MFPHGRVLEIELVQHADVFAHLAVVVVVQQEPVKALREVPFDELRELVAHEVQLFARMGHLIGVKDAQVVEFIVVIAGHLVDE